MESQRLAAEYLTKAWGVADAQYDIPSAAEKMASKIFNKFQEILHKEQELVKGSVSGYFTPIAGEKTTGEIFRAITSFIYVKGDVGS